MFHRISWMLEVWWVRVLVAASIFVLWFIEVDFFCELVINHLIPFLHGLKKCFSIKVGLVWVLFVIYNCWVYWVPYWVLKLGKVQSCWGSHYQYSYIRDEVNILMKHTNGLVEPFGLASGVGTILSTYFAWFLKLNPTMLSSPNFFLMAMPIDVCIFFWESLLITKVILMHSFKATMLILFLVKLMLIFSWW